MRPAKTRGELKALATDFLQQRVRGTLDPARVQQAFSILFFMDDAAWAEWAAEEPVFCYEYLNTAAPLAANGCPVFFSVQWLTASEYAILYELYDSLKAALETVT